MGRAVKVAEGKKRPYPQQQRRMLAFQPDGGAYEQDLPFAQQYEFAGKEQIRQTVMVLGPVVHLHAVKILMSMWMKYAGMLPGRKAKLLAPSLNRHFHSAEQNTAPRPAGNIHHQQAVIFSRIAAENRAGRIVAAAIGQQPFLAQSFADILTFRLIKYKVHELDLSNNKTTNTMPPWKTRGRRNARKFETVIMGMGIWQFTYFLLHKGTFVEGVYAG
jgi:hypothetical protein